MCPVRVRACVCVCVGSRVFALCSSGMKLGLCAATSKAGCTCSLDGVSWDTDLNSRASESSQEGIGKRRRPVREGSPDRRTSKELSEAECIQQVEGHVGSLGTGGREPRANTPVAAAGR